MKNVSEIPPSSAPTRSQFYYWITSHNWCGFADPLVAAIKTPLGALVAAFIVVLILGVIQICVLVVQGKFFEV